MQVATLDQRVVAFHTSMESILEEVVDKESPALASDGSDRQVL